MTAPVVASSKCTSPSFTPATSAPLVAGHNLPLVQISVPRVQISILQVKLHPRTSRPLSDAARKCDTAQRYIFEFVNMIMTL
jgi:hypothetical protein